MGSQKLSRGQYLRKARLRLGWSQEHLAEVAGVSSMSISRWEHDLVVPQPHHQMQICSILNIDIEDVFGGDCNLNT